MQHRMKNYSLTTQQMICLLERAPVGSLATLNPNATPYITPIHFIYYDKAIYFHGLAKGKKIDNLSQNAIVGFSVYEMDKLLLDINGKPCDTNTKYESVNICGTAKIIDNMEMKANIIKRIVEKYTPDLLEREIPPNMIKGTAIIKIEVLEMTGKYYV